VFGVEAFVIVWSGVVSFGSVYDKWGFAPPPAVKTVEAKSPPGLTQRQAAKLQPKRLSIAKFLSEGRLRSAWVAYSIYSAVKQRCSGCANITPLQFYEARGSPT